MALTPPQVDPEVAAAAAAIRSGAAESEPETQAPFGRDNNERPNVPGFTSNDPVTPEPLLPGEQTAPAAEAPATQHEALPLFEADTSGIEELLADDEPEQPEDAEPPSFTDEDETDDYEDPETAKQNKRLKELEKKYAWAEEQRVRLASKNWREEAKRRFPLAATDEIAATSRRSFLKAASKQHEAAAKVVKPLLDAIASGGEQAFAQAKADGRAHAVKSWGKPTVGPPEPVIERATQAAEEAALDRGNFKTLGDRMSALMKAGKLNI